MTRARSKKPGRRDARRRPVTVRRPQQIRALVSPSRQEIVDTVQALGICSVREVAAELGRPSDGLYYHFRALLGAGLLRASGTRGEGGRREALYAIAGPGEGLRLHYDPADRRNATAVTRVVASMLRVTERDFRAAFRPGVAICDGPRRNLWAARMKGWLTEQEIEEVNELLRRLQQVLDRPRRPGERHLHALTFVLAPVEASDVRRGGQDPETP